MNPVDKIGRLLEDPLLASLTDPQQWWDRQAELEERLAGHFRERTTDAWLELLDADDVWCAPVLTLEQLVGHEGFRAIAMTQEVERGEALTADGRPLRLRTTRSPIRIDGERLTNPRPAPLLGQHDAAVWAEFLGAGPAGVEASPAPTRRAPAAEPALGELPAGGTR